ncbi:MAG: hypothetical protein IZT59_01510 [Verrucomicrobia bacterium]|jgi:hypothetical protein|nr:hypothetical protein [Verrucomicrobiota bacterium]|tara:strand:- start:8483 stop:8728 length:246 start_codon:yes stop_codon:yes gene_type:complete
MAFTPSKDHKRREREQKKLDKKFARDEAKAEQLLVKQAEDEAAEVAAIEAERLAGMTQEEIEFEQELAAEEAANNKSGAGK